MNDFTKEELKHLYYELRCLTELYEEPDIMYTIKDKIKSMIDNYYMTKSPTMATYVCDKCCEECRNCECKDNNK